MAAIFCAAREDGLPGKAVWFQAGNGGQVLIGNFDDDAAAVAAMEGEWLKVFGVKAPWLRNQDERSAMTFEAFVAARKTMSVPNFCEQIGVHDDAFAGAVEVLAYPNGHYIEVREGGIRALIIGRMEYWEPEYTLDAMERILYDATHENGEYVGI